MRGHEGNRSLATESWKDGGCDRQEPEIGRGQRNGGHVQKL